MTEIKAYAKINPFLDIVSKRPDGYHDIKSYMQTVDFYDTISIEVCEGDISVIGMPDVEETKNLAYKAAKAFFDKTGIPAGLKIFIDKRIPSEAGLGGGSSDAAAVLRGLNEIFETNLSNEELVEMAQSVGSDVPFFVFGGSKLVSGRGEIIEDAPIFPDCYIVIAKGAAGANTAEQYAKLDAIYSGFSSYDAKNEYFDNLINGIRNKNFFDIGENLYNIFEYTAGVDENIKNAMRFCGASGALLSGSGSSCFGIFIDRKDATRACDTLKNHGYKAFLTQPKR